MSEAIVYEASIYSRTISYTNFKGVKQNIELFFALDPMALMAVIAGVEIKKPKSGNPVKQQKFELTDEQQLRFVRDLASRSAGFPSEDGESWEPFEDFDKHIAGQAFLTKLASSDGDRQEFVEKVILAPFESFVNFAVADDSNSAKEKQQFKTMLDQVKNVFRDKPSDETLEDRKARLAAELESLNTDES